MKSLRALAIAAAVLSFSSAPTSAQYMTITTDNPLDSHRMRATGTTILTITVDTNHDKNGTLQTCNSHQVAAGCFGAVGTAQALDMFGYTLALKAVGGTVQWGTFTASDANYTNSSPQIQNGTEVEVNQFRPTGTFTPPGLATIGTIPVTILTGSPAVNLKVGYSQPTDLNPAGYGTGFATECDGTQNFNFYIVGDPLDPCGSNPGGPANGLAGDWFDWDGALSASGNTPPAISVAGTASATENTPMAITATATDPDAGASITVTQTGMPADLTFSSTPGLSPVTATISGTPGFDDQGTKTITWFASDGTDTSNRTTVLTIQNVNRAPVLTQPANMTVNEGTTAEQILSATDPDNDPLTYSIVAGPVYLSISPPSTVRLLPGFNDAGTRSATVRASDGSLSDAKTFQITVNNVNRPPILGTVNNMTVHEGATANQTLTSTDQDGEALAFAKVTGPGYMTVSTTTPGTGTATGNIHLAPGFSDAGTASASVRSGDTSGGFSAVRSFTITVIDSPQTNTPPVLAQPVNMTVDEGTMGNQTLTATDADGDSITFSKTTGPTYMTVTTTIPGTGTATGNVHFAPGFVDAGTATAVVRATAIAAFDEKSFTVVVNNVDRAPVLFPVNDMTVPEGATADQMINGSDADADPLTFFKASGPAFMVVTTTNPTTGNIHLAPVAGNAGTYAASVSASDGFLSSTRVFSIIVNAGANQVPVLEQPADMIVNEGATATQVLNASDADGDALNFSKASGPAFMTVSTTDPGTGVGTGNVHLAPGFQDAGTYFVTVRASDASTSSDRSFTINVTPTNRPPVLDTVSNMTTEEGVTADQVITGSDADGDSLTFEKFSGPAFMSVLNTNATSGFIHLFPPLGTTGTFSAGVSAVDPSNASMTQGFQITVTARTGNRPPNLVQPIDLTMNEGEVADQTISGTDPDETPLTFSLVSGPTFMDLTTLNSVHANVHITPGFLDAGTYVATVRASDGELFDQKSWTTYVNNTNQGHVLAQPADMMVREGETQDQTLTTTDANTDPLVFTKVDGPPFMTVSTAISDTGMTTGNVHLAPGFFDAGSFQATVRVTDGALSDDKSFSIVVTNASPVVTSPEFATVEEEAELSVTVTASDPDNDPITLTVDRSALPAENDAAFTTNGSHTQGTLVWHPVTGDIGTYPVTFIAVAPDTGRSVTRIRVVPQGTKAVGDLAWTPAAPDTGVYTVTFTAVDGDNEVGTAQTIVTVLPASSARIANPPRVHYAPDRSQRGPIISVIASVTLTAGQSLLITASAVDPDRGPIISFTEEITGPSIPANPPTFTVSLDPQVTVPQNIDGTDGVPIDFEVSAGDPDGEPILALSADLSDIPTTNPAQFTTTANNALGHFHWVPQPVDVRDQAYRVAFTASNALTVTDTTRIAIHRSNHAPVASAGGPYSTFVNLPLELNGTGSSDPDGDALRYLWRFGDGASGLGATPTHTYKNAGDYSAVLTVTDIVPQAALADSESTMVNIRAVLQASAFTLGADKIIKLKSGKPISCVQIEPAEPGFSVSEIDLFSIVLHSEGTGAVTEIHAAPRKLGLVQDANRNGVPDVSACFQKADLRALFANVSGTQQIPVEVRGRIASGAPFSASLTLTVSGASGGLAAAVDPNPLNPAAAFTFELTRAGVVRIQIFDSAGRLVRDVIAGKYFEPGFHEVQLDARDRSGRPLASGVYFYRLQAPEGNVTGRFAVLK